MRGARLNPFKYAIVVLALIGTFCSLEAAPHVDILVYREGNSARVGAYDFGASTAYQNHHVFTSLLNVEPSLTGLSFTDSPGWNGLRDAAFLPPGGAILPGGAAVGFNVLSPPLLRRNLSYWNGVGEVTFGPVPASEVLQCRKSLDASGVITIHGSDAFVPGYMIAIASGGGYVHRHFAFNLYGNASTQDTGADAPTPGIYLLSLEATVSGLTNSAPFYILLGHGTASAALDLAATWATQNLSAPSVPIFSAPAFDTNGFVRLRLSGPTGTMWRVEAAETITNWISLTNVTLESHSIELIDPLSVLRRGTQRFYRAKQR
jgi:hypothetical protein